MLLKVKVFPKSKKDKIVKKTEDSFLVYVKEKAEEGRANLRVKEILAAHFKTNLGKIKLLKGGKKQNKIFQIH